LRGGPLGAFFDIIHQDPILSQVKLIAETVGSRAGRIPGRQLSRAVDRVNGKYRDTVRRFWRGDGGTVSELATRLAGSNDLYAQAAGAVRQHQLRHRARRLHADDLVSYNEKHNEANLEDDRDGEKQQPELELRRRGPTDDPAIRELRGAQMRNFLATLLLSQGVPMISHGDEVAARSMATTTPTARTTS
jgi:glycogen operon protein